MRVRVALPVLLALVAASPVEAAPAARPLGAAVVAALGPCGDPCVIHSNNGGRIVVFEDAADEIRRGARKRVVIDGYCASACMVLAARARSKVCITDRATFGFHRTNRGRPIPVSGDMHVWIVRNGGYPAFGATPGFMPNNVARRFWRRCA